MTKLPDSTLLVVELLNNLSAIGDNNCSDATPLWGWADAKMENRNFNGQIDVKFGL